MDRWKEWEDFERMPNYTFPMSQLSFNTGKLISHLDIDGQIGAMTIMNQFGDDFGSHRYYRSTQPLINERPDQAKAVVKGSAIDVYFFVQPSFYDMPREVFVNFDIYGGENVDITTFEVSNNFSLFQMNDWQNLVTWEAATPNARHVFTNTTKDCERSWGVACHIVAECESGEMTLTAPLIVVGPAWQMEE